MRGLQGRVAIVTGAASNLGMGFAAAKRLAEEGVRVVLTDISDTAVLERARELRDAGHEALGLAHDVTDEASWDAVIHRSEEKFGGLDILVNNAAILVLSPVADMSLLDWRRQLDVNLSSTFLGCRAAVRQMRKRGGGAIVNTSSIAASVAQLDAAAYCASKAGVQMLTKVLAIEVARDGIRVNSVHPGPISTQMLHGTFTDAAMEGAQVSARVPLGRLGAADDVAAAVAFLASDDAQYCTGTGIVVDGGLTAQ